MVYESGLAINCAVDGEIEEIVGQCDAVPIGIVVAEVFVSCIEVTEKDGVWKIGEVLEQRN